MIQAIQAPKEITVSKYKGHWAVYLDSRLLAVTVYKRGADAVKHLLELLFSGAHQSASDSSPSEVRRHESEHALTTQTRIQPAIAVAVDKAEKQFAGNRTLPSLTVMHNPCSGRTKLTPHPDCEDGMYRFGYYVGPSGSAPR